MSDLAPTLRELARRADDEELSGVALIWFDGRQELITVTKHAAGADPKEMLAFLGKNIGEDVSRSIMSLWFREP